MAQTKRFTRCETTKPTAGFHKNSKSADGRQGYGIESNTRHAQSAEWAKAGINMTHEEYDDVLAEQGGICATSKEPGKKRPAVDHEHRTGRVRGRLCFDCDSGLGKFCDDVAVLGRAVEYLERNLGDKWRGAIRNVAASNSFCRTAWGITLKSLVTIDHRTSERMDIKPNDLTVKSLLESGFYKIPRFQRPYSWDRENIEEFWNDAVVADDADYFIGSFVVYKTSDPYGPLYVVDGQQRLTTITIMLAAVRGALDEAEFPNQAIGVQQLIERQDINAQQQYVLQTETSYPFLQEHIQKHGKAELPGRTGSEETALKEAYVYLRSQIREGVRGIQNDPSKSTAKKQKDTLAYLIRIRDQVLRLQLIQIQLTKEEEAYLIFETLNTRGKDLAVSDLVKNHLARLMKPKNKGVDVLRDKWNQALDLLESSRVDLSLSRFLHHAWLSRRNYTGEKLLFAAIKDSVNKDNAATFLDELLSDAKAYRTVFEPEYHKWKKEERQIEASLRALQIFRVMQPAPMLLAVVRALFGKNITIRQASQVLRVMEHFHLHFTAVTAQRTGGGTAKMYALGARVLSEAKNKDEAAKALNDFINKLRERVPTEAAFLAGFAELRYSDENTKQKNLVRYILQRIDEHFRPNAPADYSKFSIEHIAPQRPPTGAPVTRFAEIGNLILVPEDLNTGLRNDPFSKKKVKMQAEQVPFDPSLDSATAWDDAAIEGRSKALGALAFNTLFTV